MSCTWKTKVRVKRGRRKKGKIKEREEGEEKTMGGRKERRVGKKKEGEGKEKE